VVVDAREPGRERWVAASGAVEILRGDEARVINARIRQRYLTPAARDSPIEPDLAESDDVTLELTPGTWRSWAVELGEAAAEWFLPVQP